VTEVVFSVTEGVSQRDGTGANPGCREPAPPYFWQSQLYFFTLYTMSEENIFEIEF